VTDLRSWEAWHKVHQPYELEWWRRAIEEGHYRGNGHAKEVKQFVKFIQPFGNTLDVGCGPSPMFHPSTVIEPLAVEFRKLVPEEWWEDVAVYARPAEEHLEQLDGKFDTVVCWNCLDHAVGWREILANMRAYVKPDGRVSVATDFHDPYPGHPGFGREEFEAEVAKHFVVVDKREPLGRQLAIRMRTRTE
jgi:SAM-dependent methyltransferase